MQARGSDAAAGFPRTEQHFPGDSGLAEHCNDAMTISEPLQVFQNHPFGDIEVALSGNGVIAASFVKIGLDRKVIALQDAEFRTGNPGRVPYDKKGLRKAEQDLVPIGGEKIFAFQADAIMKAFLRNR